MLVVNLKGLIFNSFLNIYILEDKQCYEYLYQKM
jgi:hypothetical protein